MDIRRRELMRAFRIGINDYLTIEALEDGLTVSLSNNGCYYCVDGDGNWKLLTSRGTESINTGHTLSFRGKLTPTSSNGIGTFTISKKCNLKGNCMSMLFENNAANNFSLSSKNHAFYKLFQNCTNIVSISENFLPATTLGNYCYLNMFYGCTSLKTAPELPATTLTDYCYYYMFKGCTSLIVAPKLPATELTTYCYSSMFNGCKALTTAPELPATTLEDYCYYNMFCYCTKLNYIKMLATDISASDCLYNWVNGVASSGTFVKNPAMNSLPTGTSGIPSGWTVVNDGELLVTYGENADEVYWYLYDKYGLCNEKQIDETIVLTGISGYEGYTDGEYNVITIEPNCFYIYTGNGKYVWYNNGSWYIVRDGGGSN